MKIEKKAGMSLLVWDEDLTRKIEESINNNTFGPKHTLIISGPDTAAEVTESLVDYPDAEKYIYSEEYKYLGAAVRINSNNICIWHICFR